MGGFLVGLWTARRGRRGRVRTRMLRWRFRKLAGLGVENLVFPSASSILGHHEKQTWGFTRLAGRALVRVKTALLSLHDEESRV